MGELALDLLPMTGKPFVESLSAFRIRTPRHEYGDTRRKDRR
jgi:hypothetical protein